MKRSESTAGLGGGVHLQPFAIMVGSSLHFSDQILRVLRMEFEGVQFERVATAGGVFELTTPPNVVIVHEMNPNLAGLCEEVRKALPRTLIAIACNDTAVFQRTSRSLSFPISLLQLNSQLDVWFSVLRLLLCGHVYLPVDLVGQRQGDHTAVTSGGDGGVPSDVQLTPREMDILPLIARGMQNKTIAGELGLSEHTVKLHTHNIFSKLRVSNRTGAANWYFSQMEGASHVGHDSYGK